MKQIKLTQGRVTLVDDCDYEWLNKHKWSYDGRYVLRQSTGVSGKRQTILMHRAILKHQGFEDFAETDHINGKKLDNRRKNLRPATGSQNRHNRKKYSNNTSGFKGVYWNKFCRKWNAQIWLNGRRKHLGLFTNLKEAAKAYNEAARKLHGEFAVLNEVG